VSEREAAQKAYAERQKFINPSAFDTLGAFNKYYQKPGKETSFAVPLDFASAIPTKDRASLIESFNPTTRTFKEEYFNTVIAPQLPADQQKNGFWAKTAETLEKGYNLAAQAVVFGLGVAEKNNPLWKGEFSVERIRESWDAARNISPGQMMLSTIAQNSISLFDEVTGTLGDSFIKDNLLFGANNFDIYNSAERKKAFEEQTLGRVGSWTGDVISRFVIDPAIVVGKAYKVYKTGKYAFKSAEEFGKITAETAEGLTKRQQRLRATFNDFLERTDGLDEQNLFRVKAIRESSNPGIMANLLATANKIEDTTARHAAKTNIIHMAMGDADAFTQLANQSDLLAAQVGNLRAEVPQMKFLTGRPAEDGQMAFNYMNDGAEYEKHLLLIKEYEEDIAKIHKQLASVGTMDPKKVPFVDVGSDLRRQFVNSQNFIDFRSNSGTMVRFHTGFFYKRPRGWIDYTDNQSVQTIDNQLSRVVGLGDRQRKVYQAEIDSLKARIAATTDEEELAALNRKLKKTEFSFDKASSFTVERRNELFSKYTNAVDADERAFAHAEIERELFTVVARQFGYSDNDVAKAYTLFANRRQRATNLIKERLYTGATDPKTGLPVGTKAVIDEGGMSHVFAAPINETHLAKQMPTLDIDTMYKVLKRATSAERLKDATTGAPKVYSAYSKAMQVKLGTGDLADALDQLLKFQVLARLGYPVRNLTEGNLRVFSVLGAWTMLETLGKGSMNKMTSLVNRVGGKNAAADAIEFAEKAKLQAERNKLFASRELVDDTTQLDAQIFEIDQILEGKALMKPEFGVGEIELFGLKLQDAKGLTPAQAAYYNDKFISSAGQVVDTSLSQVKDSITNSIQLTGDFVRINGTDPNWAEAYLRVVNRQVRGSKIGQKFLEGKSIDEVEMWLQTSDEGRRILRPFGRIGKTARDLAEENAENVRHLFRGNENFMAVALKRNLTTDDITRFLGDVADAYPSVNGAQASEILGGNIVSRLSSEVANKFYKWAGEVPESKLVRSPLYVNLYRRRLGALVEQAIETTKGDTIDPRYLRSLENKARQWARSEMRRTVYDVAEKTDAAYTLKYMFPFFGAFSDVMEKWLRIGLDNPAALRALQTTYESPDRSGMVEERDGIKYINIPGEWAKRMSLGKVDRPLQIPKPSLNLIFQGGAWWNPGAGWFAQYALSTLVKRYPVSETNKIISEVLPYGAESTKVRDLLVQSAAARKALARFDENDPMRTRLTVLVMAEENAKYDQGLRSTPPTKDEVNKKALRILSLEIVTRLVLPFATNTRSPYQFYIDKYQELRREDPDNAADIFYNRYGEDFFYFTTSLSKNNTGIAATLSAYERSQQLSDLIAESPEYGWFLVGDANAGEFSPTVYGIQQEQPIAPGSTVKFRERKDPYEAFEETQADLGWREYRKGMAILEAERIDRGLKSLSSKGAEDLALAKAEFINNLVDEYPGWGKAYGNIDIQYVNKFLNQASKWVSDSRLSGRNDMQTFRDYLEGRRYVREQLAGRASKSINAQSNADLKAIWDEFTGGLLDEDITFERIYYRVLEKDDLTKGF
jgi:hypothetical protein